MSTISHQPLRVSSLPRINVNTKLAASSRNNYESHGTTRPHSLYTD